MVKSAEHKRKVACLIVYVRDNEEGERGAFRTENYLTRLSKAKLLYPEFDHYRILKIINTQIA